jgi:hypothetical protein
VDQLTLLWEILISDLSLEKRNLNSFALSSSRTGCYFFPSAGKSNQTDVSGRRIALIFRPNIKQKWYSLGLVFTPSKRVGRPSKRMAEGSF